MAAAERARGAGPASTLLLLIALSGAVRLAACWNELWLDEIWSLRLTREIDSPLGVLTALPTDNNHPLNTLWLYAVRGSLPDWAYRLPAWAAGTASVLLAALVLRAQAAAEPGARGAGRAGELAAAGLVGGSYLLTHYSSEARGYAPALALALLAAWAAFRGHAVEGGTQGRGSGRWRALYGAALPLALLFHPLAVHVGAALVAWSGVRQMRIRPPGPALRALLAWHAAPAAVAALFYALHLRHVLVGGGPPEPALAMAAEAFAYALGVPVEASAAVAAPIAGAGLAAGIAVLVRRGADLAVFYAVGIALAPLALLGLAVDPRVVFARYFLLNAALWLLLVGWLLGLAWQKGPRSRIACALLLALFALGSAGHTARLLALGRGHTRELVRYVHRESPGPEITYRSDQRFRVPLVIEYHAGPLPGEKRLVHLGEDAAGARWAIHHSFTRESPRRDSFRDRAGHLYRLERTYPYAALSGWSWFLFRNVGREPSEGPPRHGESPAGGLGTSRGPG